MTDVTVTDFAWTSADLPSLRQQLLDLFCQVAYKEGDFLLSSGQRSTYYINGKQVTLHPQGSVGVGRILLPLIPATTIGVAGLTLGADPIVSATSAVGVYENRSLTPLIVRKEAKGHGTQAYIEGPTLPEGSPVVVLEDVVTTGQSAMKAVERLRGAGYQVEQIITLVDRQQGGAEFYAAQGLKFDAVFTIADLQAHWQKLHA
ncbi:orotate phosphoribosyltransferase [filamentous cyanobacterium LEGE 11480]|uniref:Orotate phosphoribosyltransferase n=1 Tax=Romeriopsis navalis LEGE 11480 TaxID=2777977 RepID=A0A928Z1A1_9CYAN|nr:orotate phosphoribosyltransferase [Romeriopsis navalis]MBE9029116.1 orotate phosphoribosyltransferase [Romeriopsis navalis LEGE 11480]